MNGSTNLTIISVSANMIWWRQPATHPPASSRVGNSVLSIFCSLRISANGRLAELRRDPLRCSLSRQVRNEAELLTY